MDAPVTRARALSHSYPHYEREVTPRRLFHGLYRLASAADPPEDLPKIRELLTAEEYVGKARLGEVMGSS